MKLYCRRAQLTDDLDDSLIATSGDATLDHPCRWCGRLEDFFDVTGTTSKGHYTQRASDGRGTREQILEVSNFGSRLFRITGNRTTPERAQRDQTSVKDLLVFRSLLYRPQTHH